VIILNAGHIAVRPVEAADKAECYGIARTDEDYWNNGRHCFQSKPRMSAADCGDHRYLPTYQVGCQRRQPFVFEYRPPVFDPQVSASHEAVCLQASDKGGGKFARLVACSRAEKSYRRNLILFGWKRLRNPRRCSAEQSKEISSSEFEHRSLTR
jgi:hypothetical protein